MNVAIVGTGYVGLVTGTCFADTGIQVTCVDIDEHKVDDMRSGVVPIYEPGLEAIFERNTEQGRLEFTTDLEAAVSNSQVIFLALPTPPGEDGSADLSYVLDVAQQLGELIDEYKVIVDKSTVPVGTGEKVRATIAEKVDEALFDVVSNPEFLREGVAVEDFMKPDRVVIGADSERAMDIMHRLYEPFVRQGNPIISMDVRSAEMTKYAANSYLASRISFMNEIANLCEHLGADVDQVRKGIGTDSRIGKRFLFPGVGFGGSCFPKDVKALVRTSDQNDYHFQILKAVLEVNERQKRVLVGKIDRYFDGQLSDKTIAIWGLSFKPETDDIREAPSLNIIEELLDLGASLRVYDPEAIDNVKEYLGDRENLEYADDPYETLRDCDALAIITEWSVFRTPSFEKMKNQLKNPLIFDGRNLYDLHRMEEKGFYYESIGRNTIKAANS